MLCCGPEQWCCNLHSTASSLTAATHTITATYGGDANYVSATATLNQGVNKATATITTLPTASSLSYGQTLAFSSLSGGVGSPAGGSFAWTTPSTVPPAGIQSESITYIPTDLANYNVGSSTINVTVSQARPTIGLTSTVNPSTYLTSVTFTGSLTASGSGSMPTGTITFKDGAVTLCSGVALTAGRATCTASALTAGAHSITANYSGDANYASNSGSLTQTVNAGNASITTLPTPSPLTYGQTLSSSTLTGGVGNPAAGAFSWTTPSTVPPAGTPAEGITYRPTDATDWNSVTGTVNVTVNKAAPTMTLTSSLLTVTYPASATFTVALQAAGGGLVPTGTVTFIDGATTICSAVVVSGGNATCTPASLSVGSHPITATYSGDSNYNSASGALSETVLGKSQTIVWNPAPPMTVTFGVSPFTLNATATSGLAVVFNVQSGPGSDAGNNMSVTGAGNIVVCANQAGDSTWTAAPQSCVTISSSLGKAVLTLSSLINPSTYTGRATIKATVGTLGGTYATGTVTFTTGSTTLCGAVSMANGQASCAFSAIAVGAHTVTAVYSGDSNYSAGTGIITQNIVPAQSSIVTPPTATTITVGQPLSASILSGGSGSPAGGTFTWASPNTLPAAGTQLETVVYTPPDSVDYLTSTTTVSITVSTSPAVKKVVTAKITK